MTTRSGLRLICADSWLVAVHKPSGVPSVPARNPLDPPSVAEQLHASHGPLEAVHRLDRDTSGVLVLARHREARVRLGRLFEQGITKKRYLAICHGRPPMAEGDLHLPLAADLSRRPRQRVDPIHGRRAQTRWRLLATEETEGEHRSLLELEPRTGRSHQLRVHMAWLGTPVVGDRLYGRQPQDCPLRLALHAAFLSLPHPRDGEPISFLAAAVNLPASPPLAAALAQWMSLQEAAHPGCMADFRTFDQ
jgi:tRNA pseudouridine32 synthase/23S rRNA pseudouridine746 synthase